ncbi:MAG: hypothetical protein ABIU77_27310 [Ferruginibacter sp.]
MNKVLFSILLILALLPEGVYAQQKEDKLNLPGDNLNLYAVLKLFQESETLENFEQKLNEENSEINNLDLDGDDKTDYIKVIDNVDDNVHTIVLQTDINASEKQDVAVFTVEKNAIGKVQVQLIGDEDLYGKDYIIEPNEDVNASETLNPGYTGNKTVVQNQSANAAKTMTVIVGSWPLVRYIYLPTYVVWHSPWYYNYYPSYWRPWRPLYWHQYWGYHSNWNSWYFGYYRRWPAYRYNRWNDFYYSSRRTHSVVVITRRQNGLYRSTYSKPETKQQGIALYNKRNPGGSRFPNKPSIQRPVTKPLQPVSGPGVQKPVKKPTRPVVQKPIIKTVQPAIRPAIQKPAVRPTRPAIQKPVVRPIIQKAGSPVDKSWKGQILRTELTR